MKKQTEKRNIFIQDSYSDVIDVLFTLAPNCVQTRGPLQETNKQTVAYLHQGTGLRAKHKGTSDTSQNMGESQSAMLREQPKLHRVRVNTICFHLKVLQQAKLIYSEKLPAVVA